MRNLLKSKASSGRVPLNEWISPVGNGEKLGQCQTSMTDFFCDNSSHTRRKK